MINGIININKEKGFTSHDVVAKLRGILKQKKIGHTGTLDPDATGVLPVCLGSATKLCDMMNDHAKEYEATLLLGVATDTEDVSGTVLETHAVNVDVEAVREAIMSFVGSYDQIPPMYSAIKIEGKKLYELARAGKVIERKPRKVDIIDITIKEMSLPRVVFRVKCSKGTYIRSLCRDIGEKLGCLGCMEALIRTQVGRFYIDSSITLSDVEELVRNGIIESAVIATDEFFADLPEFHAQDNHYKLVKNGNPIKLEFIGEEIRVYLRDDAGDSFAGVYCYDSTDMLYRPKKMFLSGE